MTNQKEIKAAMITHLKDRYDYIGKLDALFYLKESFPGATLQEKTEAWNEAYE